MKKEALTTDVLIVGAGPVGLGMAIELGSRGIRCIIIDQQMREARLPRAAGLTWRTMEFCRRWGIADRVYNAGFPRDYRMDIVYCTSLRGHLLEREPYEPLGSRGAPFFSPQDRERCPQKMFDPVLEKRAREFETVDFRRPYRLEQFWESNDGVVARARRLGQERENDFSGDNVATVQYGLGESVAEDLVDIHAQYLVACDGVDSGVRNALGIELDGTPLINYTVSLLVRAPGLQKHHPMGEAERYMLIGPEGVWGNLTVVDGREEWRLSLTGSKEKLDLANLDTDAIVKRCFGADDIPYKVEAVAPWRRREVVAQQLRCGRIFLAGDAAHAMSPTGGFGMNTGLGDVFDLGWKLEAVLRGWGGGLLLQSYDAERRPVGKRFVSAATVLFRPWMLKLDYSRILDDTPEGEATRREVGSTFKRVLLPEWEIAGTSMGYRYSDSPINVPDGTQPPEDDSMLYIQTSWPGARAPHAWLPDGRSTLDLFGRGFTLLRFDRGCDVHPLKEAAAAQGVPMTVEDVDNPDIARLYERKLVLVRPDGHVAWRSDTPPRVPAELVDTIRGAGTSPASVRAPALGESVVN